MYSFTASMLHLSYAEISTIGNDSAAVVVRGGNQLANDMCGGKNRHLIRTRKCSFSALRLGPL